MDRFIFQSVAMTCMGIVQTVVTLKAGSQEAVTAEGDATGKRAGRDGATETSDSGEEEEDVGFAGRGGLIEGDGLDFHSVPGTRPILCTHYLMGVHYGQKLGQASRSVSPAKLGQASSRGIFLMGDGRHTRRCRTSGKPPRGFALDQ